MSIQDFTEKLKISIGDLMANKEKCITNVMLNSINPLELRERPFHCSNLEKNKWVIKDKKEGWQEDDGNSIIESTEKGIGKQFSAIYHKAKPGFQSTENYVKIVGQTFSDLKSTEKKKILKEIAESVLLSKDTPKDREDKCMDTAAN